jgi:hypothetical protein
MLGTIALAAGLIVSLGGYAEAPATAPAGTTGLCKDGSYYSGATKKGACAKHGGVKEWYGAKETKPAAAAAPAASTPAASAPAASTRSAAPTKEVPASTKTAAPKPEATPAPGGGSGKVWVNTNSKIYHCEGTRWYGKTKNGEYMSEAAAKAAGNRPDHGKGCS